ncbi:DUF4870 domain-containing protein [Myroides sp. M-43]|uniref:DUF4870 domain-containing protein n=1 Tax=Myroides oncorhynchi TaxID=2893756 RepID=UPI001E2EA5DF|nr:DUF4870 domain-containing protein [Myroides oncorhynchi]MCC9042203.1 DUF4870 domain-containing protein [Myroides oncorhynchi]
MDNKTLSIVSYITIIGWLVAYFIGKEKADDLLKYHLRQSLGIMLISIVLNVALVIVISIIPSLYFLAYIGYAIMLFWIIGIINAANEKQQPLPVIGEWADKTFTFIK